MRKSLPWLKPVFVQAIVRKLDWQSHKENVFSSFFREYVEVRAIFSISVTAVWM